MPSLSIDLGFNVFGLLWGMKLHYELINECYCLYRKMSPRTRSQGRRIALLDMSDKAFVRPPPTVP